MIENFHSLSIVGMPCHTFLMDLFTQHISLGPYKRYKEGLSDANWRILWVPFFMDWADYIYVPIDGHVFNRSDFAKKLLLAPFLSSVVLRMKAKQNYDIMTRAALISALVTLSFFSIGTWPRGSSVQKKPPSSVLVSSIALIAKAWC